MCVCVCVCVYMSQTYILLNSGIGKRVKSSLQSECVEFSIYLIYCAIEFSFDQIKFIFQFAISNARLKKTVSILFLK